MKIGTNIVTGLYKYSPNVVYTLGDYIIHNRTVFEVMVAEITNSVPTVGSNYKLLLNNNNVLINNLNDFLLNEASNIPVSASLLKDIIYYYIGGLIGPNNIENYSSNPMIDLNFINRNCIMKIGDKTLNSPMPFTDAILRSTGFDNQNNVILNPGGNVYQEVYADTFLAVRSGIYNHSNGLIAWNVWNVKFDDISYHNSLTNYTNGIIQALTIASTTLSNINNYAPVMRKVNLTASGGNYELDTYLPNGANAVLLYKDITDSKQKSRSFVVDLATNLDIMSFVDGNTVTFVSNVVPYSIMLYV